MSELRSQLDDLAQRFQFKAKKTTKQARAFSLQVVQLLEGHGEAENLSVDQ